MTEENEPFSKDISDGMHRANKRTIKYCENEIKRLHEKGTKPNTSRQIFEDGQKKAYYKILRRLESKNEAIAENNTNN